MSLVDAIECCHETTLLIVQSREENVADVWNCVKRVFSIDAVNEDECATTICKMGRATDQTVLKRSRAADLNVSLHTVFEEA